MRQVITMGHARQWRSEQVGGAAMLLIAITVIIWAFTLGGDAWWAFLPLAAVPGVPGLLALWALFGPRRIVLTDDAMRVRDGIRLANATFVIDRRCVTGVEAFGPGRGSAPVPSRATPAPNLRVELSVAAEVRVYPDFVLAPRPARQADLRRLLPGGVMECRVRDATAARAAILSWVGDGPNGPAARRRGLTRVATAVRSWRDEQPSRPVASVGPAEYAD
jgi:hypothetical protein